MASLLNRSGNYYATFHDSARTPAQRRLSLKTRSKRTAEKMLRELDDAYNLGEWDPWTDAPADCLAPERQASPTKLAEAQARFFQDKPLAASTRRSYKSRIKRFVASVGEGKALQALTRADVQAYIDDAPDPLTAESRLTAVRSLLSFSRAEGWLQTDPAANVTKPKKPARLPRAVTDDELDAVLASVPEGRAWCRPVFEFAALAGLRVSELARMEWSHVDLESRLLTIEVQKSGKAGTQPLSRSAVALLSTLPRLGIHVFASPKETVTGERNVPAWTAQVQRTFKIAKEAAQIERHLTPHGLRHRFCTKLAEAGANAFVIQAAARHADVNTSQRYVSISNQRLRSELDSVFG